MDALVDENNDLLQETEIKNIPPSHQKDRHDLLISAVLLFGIFMAASSSGMAMGYSAVLLPQLQLNSSTIPIDDNKGSWIASIITASMPLGSMVSAIMIDKLGRIITLKTQSVIVTIGWITVACAQCYEVILLGRCIAGFASGLGVVVGQVYFTEVCKPNVRGLIGATPFVSYSVGILVVYALGAVLQWKIVAGLSISPAIIAFTVYFFLPESHLWLIKQGRIADATNALIWFKGNKTEAEKEVKEIVSRLQHQKTEERFDFKLFLKPYVLKPFFITIILNVLQTLSGVYVVVFYATDIISEMDMVDLAVSDIMAAVITAVVRMLFAIVFCFLLVYLSRRSFALISSIGTALAALVLGTCLYYKINNIFIPICLIIYVAATVGLLLLPGIMLGELFPIKARGVAGGISHTVYSISIFIVAKVYPFFKENLGICGLFWLFGASSFLLSLVAYLMLPETKNRTLMEIEDYFLEKNLFWVNRRQKLFSK